MLQRTFLPKKRRQILTGKMQHLPNGLTAMETQFGWTLSGRRLDRAPSNLVTAMHISEDNVTDVWDLETLGIRDSIEVKARLQTV